MGIISKLSVVDVISLFIIVIVIVLWKVDGMFNCKVIGNILVIIVKFVIIIGLVCFLYVLIMVFVLFIFNLFCDFIVNLMSKIEFLLMIFMSMIKLINEDRDKLYFSIVNVVKVLFVDNGKVIKIVIGCRKLWNSNMRIVYIYKILVNIVNLKFVNNFFCCLVFFVLICLILCGSDFNIDRVLILDCIFFSGLFSVLIVIDIFFVWLILFICVVFFFIEIFVMFDKGIVLYVFRIFIFCVNFKFVVFFLDKCVLMFIWWLGRFSFGMFCL